MNAIDTETQDALTRIELLPPRVILALARLGELLPAEVVVPLPEQITEVLERTGYGNVGILIAEYQVISGQFELHFPRAKKRGV